MLRNFWYAFNGKKVIALKTGEGLHEPEVVKKEFPNDDSIEFLPIANDSDLCEVRGFTSLLEKISSLNQDITFYAHTKGVSPNQPKDGLPRIRRWRNIMYAYNLYDPGRIEYILQSYGCCGCFKKYGSHHLSTGAEWHFSGTFFWFKNLRLFSKPKWAELPDDRYAVEGYLANYFPEKSAFCLFGDNPMADIYNYNEKDWFHLYRQDLEKGVPKQSVDKLLNLVGDLYQELGRDDDARKVRQMAQSGW